MAIPVPVVERVDQTADTIVVRNAISGAEINLTVNNAPVVSTTNWRVLGSWMSAGNTFGFGQLDDGRPILCGQFTRSGQTDVAFYFPGDGKWWLGRVDSGNLAWSQVGNGIGEPDDQSDGPIDKAARFFVGDFTGSGRESILVYIHGKGNWHLGQFTGTELTWTLAGNTLGFGEVGDGRPFWTGDFTGSGRVEILFYSPVDGNWWLGRISGASLSWSLAGNGIGAPPDQPGFGSFGKTVFVDDFAGSGRESILVYIRGKGNWHLGQFTGTELTWALAGNTLGFGEVGDGRPFWTGDFTGSGRSEILFFFPGDSNWWLGRLTGTQLAWSPAGNTLAFGQLGDGRPLWAAPFTGSHQTDILFYSPADQNWWLGIFKAGQISWSLAGNSRGLGPVSGRRFWTSDFQALGRHSLLFYSSTDGSWTLGWFDRAQIILPNLLSPGDTVTATQTLGGVQSQPSVTVAVELSCATQHIDRNRTGWNPYEQQLTIATCQTSTGSSKGLRHLFTHSLDGQTYTQPLYVSNLAIPGKGTHNVVFVATENATVYVFDADSASGVNASPLLQRSLLSTVNEGPMPATDLISCPNIVPSISITGTPVIDLPNQTLYLVVKIRSHTPLPTSRNTYIQRVHALDLTTLSDRGESPVEVKAAIKSAIFDPRFQNQRPGLLLHKGSLYIAWAGHCDEGPYFGWVIAYDIGSLNQIAQFNAAPDAYQETPISPTGTVELEKARDHYGAGIWQGGIALACDRDGNIYCSTGNGDFSARDGGTGYGNSVVKLSPNLTLLDYFMPFNVVNLDPLDQDLGSGAPILIPQQPGETTIPLMLACGKEGKIYVLNRSNLGKFNGAWGAQSDTNIVQTVDLYPGQTIDGAAQPTGTDAKQPGVWGGPAYAIVGSKRLIFYCGNYGTRPLGDPSPPGGPVKAFTVSDSALPLAVDLRPDSSVNQSQEVFPAINAGGATPVVSSLGNRAETALVWLIRRTNPLGLLAFSATDLTQKVVDLEAGPWNVARGAPMIEATVINGKVYVGSDGQLNVFGL